MVLSKYESQWVTVERNDCLLTGRDLQPNQAGREAICLDQLRLSYRETQKQIPDEIMKKTRLFSDDKKNVQRFGSPIAQQFNEILWSRTNIKLKIKVFSVVLKV